MGWLGGLLRLAVPKTKRSGTAPALLCLSCPAILPVPPRSSCGHPPAALLRTSAPNPIPALLLPFPPPPSKRCTGERAGTHAPDPCPGAQDVRQGGGELCPAGRAGHVGSLLGGFHSADGPCNCIVGQCFLPNACALPMSCKLPRKLTTSASSDALLLLTSCRAGSSTSQMWRRCTRAPTTPPTRPPRRVQAGA